MEPNIQEVVNSLTRQISELAVKLAIAEAQIESLRSQSEEGEE